MLQFRFTLEGERRGTRHIDSLRGDADHKVSPAQVQLNIGIFVAVAHEARRDRRSARARAACPRLAAAALPDAHGQLIFPVHAHELGVDALGKVPVVLKHGPDLLQIERIGIVNKGHAVGIAHGDAGDAVLPAPHLERDAYGALAGKVCGNVRGTQFRRPHVHADGHDGAVLYREHKRLDAAERLHCEHVLFHALDLIEKLSDAADGVAAHLALAAVRVEHAHLCIRRVTRADIHDAVPADGKVPVGKFFCNGTRIGGKPVEAVKIDIIVADAVHLVKGLCHKSANDDLLALRADGDVLNVALAEFFQEQHVVLRRPGKLFKFAAGRDIAVPAFDLFKDGLAQIERIGEREIMNDLAIQLIRRADLQFFKLGQNVQLGERDFVRALAADAVAGRDHVEGANPSGSARCSAVLAARRAQLFRLLAEVLRREGTLAHAGGVRLHDADGLIQLEVGHARADGRVRRDRRRGRRIGIDAEVDIAQCAELRFEHDALARLVRLVEVQPDVADIVFERLAVRLEIVDDFLRRDGRVSVPLFHGEVLPFHDVPDARVHPLGMQQLADTERLLHVFVRIHGRDAATGGTKLLICEALLLQAVHQHMIGHGDDRLVADPEVFGRDPDALRAKAARLLREVFDIDDHAVAEHVDDALAKDARGKQVEDEFPPLIDDGMTGIVAALIAADDVIVLGQQVDHSALAFVAPVDPADRSKHSFFLLVTAAKAYKAGCQTIGFIIQ